MSDHSSRDHARLAASSAERWLNCTGSPDLIARLGAERRDTVYSSRGTFLHELAEQALEGRLDLSAEHEREVAGFTHRLDDFERDGLQVYLSHLEDIRDGAEFQALELPLKLDDVDRDLGGTCDFCAIKDGVLHVVDLKTGRGVTVFPQDNLQLMQYAIGVAQALPRNLLAKVQTVRLTIVQPWGPVGEPVKSWDTDLAYLIGHINRLRAAAEATRQRPELTPGDWCRWCPAAVSCPALHASLQVIDDKRAELPDPRQLTPMAMGEILRRYEHLKPWLETVYELARIAAEQGIRIPGMKLVPKRGIRKYGDEARAAALLTERLGPDEAYTHKLLSPAQAEKALGKKAFAELLGELVQTVSSGMNLVPVEDAAKGPDLAPSLPSPAELGLIPGKR